MKGNTDKCHLLLSKDEPSEIHIGDSIIESSTCEKLLGIKIDSKLQKITNISSSISLHESSEKKSFNECLFKAQFNYCPLISMLHSLQNNNKIKHLHERCLRLIRNDKLSS